MWSKCDFTSGNWKYKYIVWSAAQEAPNKTCKILKGKMYILHSSYWSYSPHVKCVNTRSEKCNGVEEFEIDVDNVLHRKL